MCSFTKPFKRCCLDDKNSDKNVPPIICLSCMQLVQAPEEWVLEPGKPCSGERMLLLYDRWCDFLAASAPCGIAN
jgi:hypothetical protein